MNPESLLLLSLVEPTEMYGLKVQSLDDPRIQAADCMVELEEYPVARLQWPEKGPTVDPKEEAIIVGERMEGEEMKPYTTLTDFETAIRTFNSEIDLVLAIDTSGSMQDNTGATTQILQQVAKHFPDSRVHNWVVQYNEGGAVEMNGAERRYSGGRGTGEEDHLGALQLGLDILNREDGPGHKQYIVLLTDEGNKRAGDSELESWAAKARREGVQMHLIYDGPSIAEKPAPLPQYSRYSLYSSYRQMAPQEDFASLATTAKKTGGQVRRMEEGKVPSIFKTEHAVADYVNIDFEVADPYTPGYREFVVVNGEGARCEVEVTEKDVERAIVEGRLEEPQVVEEVTKKASTWNLPTLKFRDGVIAALGLAAGFVLGRKSVKK